MNEARSLAVIHATATASFMAVPLITPTYSPEFRIFQDVCRELKADFSEIIGPRRYGRIVRQRQAAMLICSRLMPHMNATDLGRLFKRDRTTVLHGIKQAERAENASEFSQAINTRIVDKVREAA